MTKRGKTEKTPVAAFTELHKEWFDESPRGVVLTAAAYMDDRLEEILKAFFIENDGAKELTTGFNAPLGSFSTRTSAAYALGLISEAEYEKINMLRKIRNKFAHLVAAKVANQDIAQLIQNFVSATLDAPWTPSKGKEEEDLLLHFRTSAFQLIMEFIDRPDLVRTRRLSAVNWDSFTA